MQSSDPPRIEDFFPILEVDDGPGVIGDLFWRRYREQAPDFPIHVVGFWQDDQGRRHPACYVHLTPMGETLLVGGACADNRLMRRMPAAQRAALAAAGGLYFHTLTHVFRVYADRCAAFFGYCGDRLAERIHLAAGARRTQHKHLMIYCPKPLATEHRADLIEQVQAIGPF